MSGALKHVNNSKQKTKFSRALAAGLGLALIGGASLVAAAPAHAAGDYLSPSEPDVFAADIHGAGSDFGWQLGSEFSEPSISSDGLELMPSEAVTYNFDDSYERVLDYNLSTSINRGDVTWTTSGIPANYEMVVSFGDAADPSVTRLTSTDATDGLNTAALDQTWTTSNVLGDYEAGSAQTLGDLVSYLSAQPNGKVVSIGVSAPEFAPPARAGGIFLSVVSSLSWETGTYTFRDGTRMVPGTVTLTGTPTVGSVITATTADWPEGATFSYEWFRYTPYMGDGLAGTESTHTIKADSVNYNIGLFLTVSAEGTYPVTVRANTERVTASQAPAAAAPVADSADLPAYLKGKDVPVKSAASAGLPDELNPAQAYTATIDWFAGDSFVDVYAYSTPVLVGTFPVVDGQVQIVLSSAMLSSLAAGTHTLVITGQSSGSMQAVAFSVSAVAADSTPALASTGVEAIVPLSAAGLLLLLGVALVIVRRRRTRA
jgi:LPXTG-motif cell wall-anchored protein